MKNLNWTSKIASLLLCAVLLLASIFVPASAAPQTEAEIEKELAAIEQRIKDQEQKIADLKNQKANQELLLPALEQKMTDVEAKTVLIDAEISRLGVSISGIKAQVDSLSADIGACEARIAQIDVQTAEKEAEIKEMQQQLMERLREQYMNGPVSNLQLLLSSPDLTTLMTAAEYINRKAEHDAQLRTQLEEEMAQLKRLQEQQREQQAVLEAKRADLQKQSADLVAQSLRQRESRKDLEAQQDQISDTQNEIFSTIEKLQSQSKEAQRIIEKEMRAQEEFERKLDALLAQKLATGLISKDVSNNGKMQWPFPHKGCYVTSYFGEVSSIRNGRSHTGIDISISDKSHSYNIVAALDGVVLDHGFHSSMGNYVVIVHGYYAPTGRYIKTTYMHMKSGSFTSAVVDNAKINAGTAIGIMGSTGNSTGPHLHFQVNEFTDSSMKSSNPVNPLGRYVTNTYAK